MLQVSGDFGFEFKPLPADRILSEASLDFLECDFTAEFGILGDQNLTKTSPGMLPEDSVPQRYWRRGSER